MAATANFDALACFGALLRYRSPAITSGEHMAKKTKTKKFNRAAAKKPKKAVTKKAKKTARKKPRAKKTTARKAAKKPARKAKRRVLPPTVEQLAPSGQPLFVTPLDQV